MLLSTFLNKLATERSLNTKSSVSARWYLWDGGFLAVGSTQALVPEHSHHAVQITLAVEGEMSVKEQQGDWIEAQGIIVPPDVAHSFAGRSTLGAMLFVDPESSEGVWLCSLLRGSVKVLPDVRVAPCVAELRNFVDKPFESMEVRELIRHLVQSISPGAPPARRMDPRIAKVLGAIRSSEDLRISAEEAAAKVFLSPGRFTHLFKEQVGLPFRRYMLWRKLTRAMLAIGRERTLADAAHASDFSDAAHLTRTFNQMFGIPPSAMMQGEFFEIAPPFTDGS